MICQEPIHLGAPPCYSRRLTEAGWRRGREGEQTMGRTAWSLPPFPRCAGGLHPFSRPLLQCRSQGRLPLFPSSVSVSRPVTCPRSPERKLRRRKELFALRSLLSFKPLERRDNKPGPTPNFSSLRVEREFTSPVIPIVSMWEYGNH